MDVFQSYVPQSMSALTKFHISIILSAVLFTLVAASHVANRRGIPWRSFHTLLIIITAIALVFHLADIFELMRDIYMIFERNSGSMQSNDIMMKLCRELHALSQTQCTRMMFLLTVVYLVLQSFCLPGSAFINAAIGAIIGLPLGVPYCVLVGTLGASLCYAISDIISLRCGGQSGRLVRKLRTQVEERTTADLFAYFLFLRITPFVPNWLLNMASPIAGVPLPIYAAGTFVGIIPQTYLSVRFGESALSTLSGEEVMITPWDMMWMAILGLVIISGYMLRKRYGSVDYSM
uniref:VTT domain-containing protein n=1 Tax=Trypanosoma congolense (strain IL3000) TaxID=1068625 RepID=G0UJ66_TRYCI|nr:conserved hypothetical protein [Trypanosoma congolense IL3000]